MYELISIYMGQATIVDFDLSLVTCLQMAAREMYLADGMATYVCEASL